MIVARMALNFKKFYLCSEVITIFALHDNLSVVMNPSIARAVMLKQNKVSGC